MPDVRRAADRFRTVGDGVQTWHSFSYGAHYDPDRIRFGPVMAINTEHVEPGQGYEVHDHADVEIVTWVLAGARSTPRRRWPWRWPPARRDSLPAADNHHAITGAEAIYP